MLRFLLLIFLLTPLGISAQAAWPQHPIRFIIPFGAGGPVDISTRLIAKGMSEILQQSIVVENRPGAGGNVGAAVVSKAEPDGYTFLITGVAPLSTNGHLYSNLTYKPGEDFRAVSTFVRYPQAMAVSPKLGVHDMKQLRILAEASPGKINFGSAGVGTSGHLIMSSFLHQSGLEMVHVPYKGGSSTTLALMRGDVDVAIDGLPSFTSQGLANQLPVLGVSTAERWPLAPDLPTIAEGAALPAFDFSSWVMLVAPRNTPEPIVSRLAEVADYALKSAALQSRLKDMGMLTVGGSPEDARRFLASESNKWKAIIEAAEVTLD